MFVSYPFPQVTPVEIIRARLILGGHAINSMWECTKAIVHEGGSIMSLWRAFPLTVLRDGPGVAFYLYTFQQGKKYLSKGSLEKDIALGNRVLAASTAGVVFWMYALPVDTLKTLVESRGHNDGVEKNSSLLNHIRRIYNEVGGLRYLYRSWPVALGRGIPGAAVTLTTYDILEEYFQALFREEISKGSIGR